jgi:hypothetical protein
MKGKQEGQEESDQLMLEGAEALFQGAARTKT